MRAHVLHGRISPSRHFLRGPCKKKEKASMIDHQPMIEWRAIVHIRWSDTFQKDNIASPYNARPIKRTVGRIPLERSWTLSDLFSRQTNWFCDSDMSAIMNFWSQQRTIPCPFSCQNKWLKLLDQCSDDGNRKIGKEHSRLFRPDQIYFAVFRTSPKD